MLRLLEEGALPICSLLVLDKSFSKGLSIRSYDREDVVVTIDCAAYIIKVWAAGYRDGSLLDLVGRSPGGDSRELRGAVQRPRVEATRDLHVRDQVRLGNVQPRQPDHHRLLHCHLPRSSTLCTSPPSGTVSARIAGRCWHTRPRWPISLISLKLASWTQVAQCLTQISIVIGFIGM